MTEITLTIDGKPVTVPAGTSLLDAANQAGSSVPTICFHEACTPNAVCRMCVVEVQGARVLVPACASQAVEGMVVQTQTERVLRARRTILELLDSTVDLSESPGIQAQMGEYSAQPGRFPGSEERRPSLLDDNPMFIRDYAKCVLCWRCVQVCAEDAQYTFAINYSGRGFETQIGTFANKPMPATTCVFCGQCVGVCPTGALKPKRAWLFEQGLDPQDIVQTVRPKKKRGES
jgi:NADH dehydrogenase/NADH:ubiquinone oxidoreductase subunit G